MSQYDDDAERFDELVDDDPDVCHHGVGFDRTCWRCDLETAIEEAEEREAKKK